MTLEFSREYFNATTERSGLDPLPLTRAESAPPNGRFKLGEVIKSGESSPRKAFKDCVLAGDLALRSHTHTPQYAFQHSRRASISFPILQPNPSGNERLRHQSDSFDSRMEDVPKMILSNEKYGIPIRMHAWTGGHIDGHGFF